MNFPTQFFKTKLGTGWVIINYSILFLAFPVQAQKSVDLDSTQIAQITSVDELSDVEPTNWAYLALASIIQRYGAISGYPDGTFRGNRSLSRYEFAAALQGVLEQINNGTFVNQEDLVTLRRLELEYRLPLNQLRTRLNDIDSRVTNLETNQFSVTSKLQGEIIFAFTEGRKANPTVVARTRLNFITSFTPNSRLIIQLESGNNGGDATSSVQNPSPNLLGTTGLLADGGGLEYGQVSSDVQLRRLYYTFRPQKDLEVTVGAKMPAEDFIDRNRYANDESSDFSSSFFLNNPLIIQNQIDRPGGAGAALAWNIGGGDFTLRSLYIAANSNTASGKGGLFGEVNSGTVELEYAPRSNFALRLQYTKALIDNTDISAFGINGEYAVNRTTAFFGRFGIGNYDGFNTAISQNLDLQPHTWAVGISWRDLVIPGTLTGIAIGQPFVEADLGDATQTNFEAFYKLQLSDNLSVSPIVQLIDNANNDSANGITWQATLRTSFAF
ncbi:iron uptake porin [Synechocystis sp. PCC 7509]|uniref:iron uptake porin n=1 Tax=Synechocystis sp. PCC 7509 TaxID=927677 RepID=UPI0002ACC351|nr:iron uptake porin [Synechocystis sp. PCC 7509]